MLLRAIIIDDEQKGIDVLKLLIENFTESVRVVATTTVASKAFELIENYAPEIVFLDIHMPEMNGFELLEKLNRRNFSLVFTTAHEEYALKALKNNAVDYLLKPIDWQELRIAIGRIKTIHSSSDKLPRPEMEAIASYCQSRNKNKLLIHSKTGIEYIDLEDIVCFESRSNYTYIYLADAKNILTSKTLKEFEQQLCEENSDFMRVHHSFIINLQKVTRYLKDQESIMMANDHRIPLSKKRKEMFYKWLAV